MSKNNLFLTPTDDKRNKKTFLIIFLESLHPLKKMLCTPLVNILKYLGTGNRIYTLQICSH